MRILRTIKRKKITTSALIITVLAMAGVVGLVHRSDYIQPSSEKKAASEVSSKAEGEGNTNNNPSKASQEVSNGQPTDLSRAVRYSAKGGVYSFIYPEGWQRTDSERSDGEAQIELLSPDGTRGSLMLVFATTTNPDSLALPGAIQFGTVTDLSGGLKVWQLNKDRSTRDGTKEGSVEYCPNLKLVSQRQDDVRFSQPLDNGRYLTVLGGFCIRQKNVPEGNYEEQVSSAEWHKALEIIDSIKIR